ncbi:hypothetical protein Agub_g381 [Astrephomene gubernaculifera]|uniref:Uncharacterized protein n=1 Tax=Astrephomene gubernaculifera TaxID=47775 RepID=A0AAD3DEM6_9CHLO|nr:hypothetical protein Agub_g381 [Astrephomene gubernaculifera]
MGDATLDPSALSFLQKKTLFLSIASAENANTPVGRHHPAFCPSSPKSERRYSASLGGSASTRSLSVSKQLFIGGAAREAAFRYYISAPSQQRPPLTHHASDVATQTDNPTPEGSFFASSPTSPDIVALLQLHYRAPGGPEAKPHDISPTKHHNDGLQRSQADQFRLIAHLIEASIASTEKVGAPFDPRLAEALSAARAGAAASETAGVCSAYEQEQHHSRPSTPSADGANSRQVLLMQDIAEGSSACAPSEQVVDVAAATADEAESGSSAATPESGRGSDISTESEGAAQPDSRTCSRLQQQVRQLQEELRKRALAQYDNNRTAAVSLERSLCRLQQTAAAVAAPLILTSAASAAAPAAAPPAFAPTSSSASAPASLAASPFTSQHAASPLPPLPLPPPHLLHCPATDFAALVTLSRQRDALAAQCSRLERQCRGLLSYVSMLGGNGCCASVVAGGRTALTAGGVGRGGVEAGGRLGGLQSGGEEGVSGRGQLPSGLWRGGLGQQPQEEGWWNTQVQQQEERQQGQVQQREEPCVRVRLVTRQERPEEEQQQGQQQQQGEEEVQSAAAAAAPVGVVGAGKHRHVRLHLLVTHQQEQEEGQEEVEEQGAVSCPLAPGVSAEPWRRRLEPLLLRMQAGGQAESEEEEVEQQEEEKAVKGLLPLPPMPQPACEDAGRQEEEVELEKGSGSSRSGRPSCQQQQHPTSNIQELQQQQQEQLEQEHSLQPQPLGQQQQQQHHVRWAPIANACGGGGGNGSAILPKRGGGLQGEDAEADTEPEATAILLQHASRRSNTTPTTTTLRSCRSAPVLAEDALAAFDEEDMYGYCTTSDDEGDAEDLGAADEYGEDEDDRDCTATGGMLYGSPSRRKSCGMTPKTSAAGAGAAAGRIATPPCSPRSSPCSPCHSHVGSLRVGSLRGAASSVIKGGMGASGGGGTHGDPHYVYGGSEADSDLFDLADAEWDELTSAASVHSPESLAAAVRFLREQLQLAHMDILALTTQLGSLSHQREGLRARASARDAAVQQLAINEGEALLEAQALRMQLAAERAARARLGAQCEELQDKLLAFLSGRPLHASSASQPHPYLAATPSPGASRFGPMGHCGGPPLLLPQQHSMVGSLGHHRTLHFPTPPHPPHPHHHPHNQHPHPQHLELTPQSHPQPQQQQQQQLHPPDNPRSPGPRSPGPYPRMLLQHQHQHHHNSRQQQQQHQQRSRSVPHLRPSSRVLVASSSRVPHGC